MAVAGRDPARPRGLTPRRASDRACRGSGSAHRRPGGLPTIGGRAGLHHRLVTWKAPSEPGRPWESRVERGQGRSLHEQGRCGRLAGSRRRPGDRTSPAGRMSAAHRRSRSCLGRAREARLGASATRSRVTPMGSKSSRSGLDGEVSHTWCDGSVGRAVDGLDAARLRVHRRSTRPVGRDVPAPTALGLDRPAARSSSCPSAGSRTARPAAPAATSSPIMQLHVVDRPAVEIEALALDARAGRRPSSWRARWPRAPRPPAALRAARVRDTRRSGMSAIASAGELRPVARAAEQRGAGLDRRLGRRVAVDGGGHLAGQHALRLAPARIGRVLGHRGGDPVEPAGR